MRSLLLDMRARISTAGAQAHLPVSLYIAPVGSPVSRLYQAIKLAASKRRPAMTNGKQKTRNAIAGALSITSWTACPIPRTNSASPPIQSCQKVSPTPMSIATPHVTTSQAPGVMRPHSCRRTLTMKTPARSQSRGRSSARPRPASFSNAASLSCQLLLSPFSPYYSFKRPVRGMESIKSCASMSQSLLYPFAEGGADENAYFDEHNQNQHHNG